MLTLWIYQLPILAKLCHESSVLYFYSNTYSISWYCIAVFITIASQQEASVTESPGPPWSLLILPCLEVLSRYSDFLPHSKYKHLSEFETLNWPEVSQLCEWLFVFEYLQGHLLLNQWVSNSLVLYDLFLCGHNSFKNLSQ